MPQSQGLIEKMLHKELVMGVWTGLSAPAGSKASRTSNSGEFLPPLGLGSWKFRREGVAVSGGWREPIPLPKLH